MCCNCKEMWAGMKFRPSELKLIVGQESWRDKIRIIGFAFLMLTIAGSMQQYYDLLSFRINQYQAKALAGQASFASYMDPLSDDMWDKKNTLSVVEDKEWSDLVKIQQGILTQKDDGYAVGVQGKSNGWFVQKMRYNAWEKKEEDYYNKCQDSPSASDIISCDADKYAEWETMNTNVVWFDTAPCMNYASRVGGIKDFRITPNSDDPISYGWWTEVGNSPERIDGTTDWSTDIKIEGAIGHMNGDAFKGQLKGWVDTIENCDIDCQARGSGMSLVSILNGTSLGIICFNALIMFIGAWKCWARIWSTYCTMFACVFQFAILIVSATYLFSQYTISMCSVSTEGTAEGFLWTMKDDVEMNITLWVGQMIFMFVFVAFGFCQTRVPCNDSVTKM